MTVYRLTRPYARRLQAEIAALGATVEVQDFPTATYLVVESAREDVRRLVLARVPDAVLVPDLADLS